LHCTIAECCLPTYQGNHEISEAYPLVDAARKRKENITEPNGKRQKPPKKRKGKKTRTPKLRKLGSPETHG